MTQKNILEPAHEVMEPDEFVETITREIDDHAAQAGYPEIWRRQIENATDEEIQQIVVHRLIKGYHQEIYIRDVATRSMQMAPNLKAQQALLKQVEDEHKHAFWVGDHLQKKGITPEKTKPSVDIQTMWDGYFGMARLNNFFVLLSALQLVAERGFGLQSTYGFAEAIADIEPEISHMYLEKIRRDELFHTVEMPEAMIRMYATTLEAQNDVRLGVQKGYILTHLLESDALNARKIRPDLQL